MSPPITIDPVWWISVIDIPVMTGLFWMISRNKAEAEACFERIRQIAEAGHAQLRESLSAYKLEVAKAYASIGHLKDVEKRVVSHLLRIEAKLDATAYKAESRMGGSPEGDQ